MPMFAIVIECRKMTLCDITASAARCQLRYRELTCERCHALAVSDDAGVYRVIKCRKLTLCDIGASLTPFRLGYRGLTREQNCALGRGLASGARPVDCRLPDHGEKTRTEGGRHAGRVRDRRSARGAGSARSDVR